MDLLRYRTVGLITALVDEGAIADDSSDVREYNNDLKKIFCNVVLVLFVVAAKKFCRTL